MKKAFVLILLLSGCAAQSQSDYQSYVVAQATRGLQKSVDVQVDDAGKVKAFVVYAPAQPIDPPKPHPAWAFVERLGMRALDITGIGLIAKSVGDVVESVAEHGGTKITVGGDSGNSSGRDLTHTAPVTTTTTTSDNSVRDTVEP